MSLDSLPVASFEYRGHRYEIRCWSEADLIYRRIASRSRFYELELLEYIELVVEGSPGQIVDVGANIGNHTLYFAQVLDRNVVAVEANQRLVPVLMANVAHLADRVRVVGAAAGAQPAQGDIVFKDRDQNLNVGAGFIAPVDEGGVMIRQLDEILISELDADEPIAALKADIEGMEMQMLQGASRVLAEARAHLFLEISDHRSMEKIASLLKPLGYRKMYRFCSTPVWHWAPEEKISIRSPFRLWRASLPSRLRRMRKKAKLSVRRYTGLSI